MRGATPASKGGLEGMDISEVVVETRGSVALVILNRPERMNAIGWRMLDRFRELIGELDRDDRVRAVVLTGAGRGFCAGTDLRELAEKNEAAERRPPVRNEQAAAPWDMTRIGKPTVAAVNGAAVGLGVELATQCDLRIASHAARFSWAFPHRGLIPDTGAGTYLLPRIVGLQTALNWTLSGRMVGVEEVSAAGFVDEVIDDADLRRRAVERAAELSTGAPLAIRETKRLMYQGLGRDAGGHVEDNAATLGRLFQTEDHREGVMAFLEKREPKFVGR